MCKVSIFLNLSQNNSLDLIYKFSQLFNQFNHSEIFQFYINFGNKEFLFQKEKIFLSQIFYDLKDLLKNLEGEFLVKVVTDEFIRINDVDDYYILKDIKIDEKFYKQKYKKLIPNSKIISYIGKGVISPFMFDMNGYSIPLVKETFYYLLEKNEINISELMIYKLSDFEIEILSKKLENDLELLKKCKDYILDQGIINETIYIIAGILKLNLNNISKNVDFEKISQITCQKHNFTCRPFNSFEPIGNLSSHEVYFLYLSSKIDLKNDLEEIIKCFDFEIKLIPKNNLNFNSESSFSIGSSFIFTPIELPYNDDRIFIDILDLVYSKNFDLGFHKKIFEYILDCKSKSWFRKIFCKYADKIFENEIILKENFGLYETIFKNWKKVKDKNFEKNEIIPMINFLENTWLQEKDKLILLNCYIEQWELTFNFEESIEHLNYEEGFLICENFLYCKAISIKGNEFFTKYYKNIKDRILRGKILCKLGIELKIIEKKNLKTKKIKKTDVIKECEKLIDPLVFDTEEANILLEVSSYTFSLKRHVMFNKIKQSHLEKFINNLTNVELDFIMNFIGSNIVLNEFIIKLIPVLFQKYEFAKIFRILEFILSNYKETVVLVVQEQIIILLNDMFLVEEYFELVEKLYKKLLKFDQSKILKNNEKILSCIIQSGKAMGKDVYIGNIK